MQHPRVLGCIRDGRDISRCHWSVACSTRWAKASSAIVPRRTAETSAPQCGRVHETCCRTRTSETNGAPEERDGVGGPVRGEGDGRTDMGKEREREKKTWCWQVSVFALCRAADDEWSTAAAAESAKLYPATEHKRGSHQSRIIYFFFM